MFMIHLCLLIRAILFKSFADFCCRVVCHSLPGSRAAVLRVVEDDDDLCCCVYAGINRLTVA